MTDWFVSIPSEVGRGRARGIYARGTRGGSLRFNPLGGGAGFRDHPALKRDPSTEFQSPRRAGSGSQGTLTELSRMARFNPLGGGAGSGSGMSPRAMGLMVGFNPLGGGAGSGSEVAATTGPT